MPTTPTPPPPLPYWKVLAPHANGSKIAGKKGRVLGAIVQAPEPMMRFQALEGIVGECDALGVLKHPPTSGASTVPGGGA